MPDDYERLRDALASAGIISWDESMQAYKVSMGFVNLRHVQKVVRTINQIESEHKKRPKT